MLPIYRPHSNPSEAHYTFSTFLSSLKNHCESGCCCCSCIYIYTLTLHLSIHLCICIHIERERGMLLRVISPKHFSLTWTSQVYWLVCETLLSVNHSDLTRFIRLFFFFLFFISNSARLFAMSRKGRRRFSLTLLSLPFFCERRL